MENTHKRLAVLVSGSGTNLQAIIDAIKDRSLPNTEIAIVISNKQDAYALKRAENNDIPSIFLDPKQYKSKEEYDQKLAEVIKEQNIDLIVLAGYIRILTQSFIQAFDKDKIINIHPALLPKYGGKGMYGNNVHKAVLENNEKESGCTIHYVTHEVDAGPIIAHEKVPVYENDTIESLSKRIRVKEHKLLVKAINTVLPKPIIRAK
ncbi:MAG: phosphoribosylglycinamide formyltransferase [Candidatus Melainabacteria bacterium]|nr:phosphoribosylglycinamide formyltransferase [Candidatus Melainabacteria bacterium]